MGLRPQVVASSLTASVTKIIAVFSSLARLRDALSLEAIISTLVGPTTGGLVEVCVTDRDVGGQVLATKGPRSIHYAKR